MGKTSAVFMDRDDTLMVDVGYCRNPDQVRLLPGVAEGVRLLSEGGYCVVVVTNQSGIGRGYFNERDLEAVNSRLREELRARGADFHAIYYCPHQPEVGCGCRKPRPGLLLKAASDLSLDLSSSYTIGDSEWDVEAGKAAGTQTILIYANDKSTSQPKNMSTQADLIAEDLLEAARLILKQDSGRSGSL